MEFCYWSVSRRNSESRATSSPWERKILSKMGVKGGRQGAK